MVTWLMGSFVLIELYTMDLFGDLVTNIPVPIVNSAEELADKPNIDLVVVNGWAPEITILVEKHSSYPALLQIFNILEFT